MTFNQRWRNRRIKNITPRKLSSTHIAIHTPFKPNEGASSAANDKRTAQILKKFIKQGINVLAAPTNTPYATIEAANMGSAKASMRNAIVPS